MRVTTVRDVGALVRASRHAQGLTQADLADRLGVGRDWVVRLERGHPRVEAQKVLDALVALGLILDVEVPLVADKTTAKSGGAAGEASAPRKKLGADASGSPSSARVPRKATVKKAASGTGSDRAAGKSETDPFESVFSKLMRR